MFALFSLPSLLVFVIGEVYSILLGKYKRARFAIFGVVAFVVWYYGIGFLEVQMNLTRYFSDFLGTLLLAVIMLGGIILSVNVAKVAS